MAAAAASPAPASAAAIRPATGGSCGGARALERVGEDRAALVGDAGQAPRRARRRARRASPRSSGRGESARSSAAHSSGGRSLRLRASGGSTVPSLRAVAAGLPAAHRVDAREALVEHERERVEVGALVDPVAVGLLRGHVGERADDVARARQRRVAGQVRDAEVGQLRRRARGARAVGDDHVLRLDVAVDDAAAVGVLERVGRARARPAARRGPTARRRPASAVERAPAHQLGDEVARLAVLAGVEDGDDARVVEPRGGQRLARRALGRGARPIGITFTATSRSRRSSTAA